MPQTAYLDGRSRPFAVWRRRESSLVIAAIITATATVPLLPEVPHQHLVHLPGPLRVNVILAAIVVGLLLLGVIRRRAGPWWASIGIVAAAASDPSPTIGTTVSAVAVFPLVALSALVLAAAVATLRGTVTSAYGVVIAGVSAVTSVVILRGASSANVSWLVTAILVGAVAGLMAVVRTRQRPPEASLVDLTIARQAYGTTQITACSDATAKDALLLPSGGFVPLRAALSVAVVGGDPITTREGMAQAISELHDVARGHGLIPCVFQARADLHREYEEGGYRLLKFGEEAIVDLSQWDLASPALANVRHEVARARRAGLSCRSSAVRELSADTWVQLESLSRRWRGSRFELGFSMRRVDELRRSDGVINMAVNADGAVVAFTSWHGLSDGIALDMMRRDVTAPAGAMDLCISQALIDAKQGNLNWASLGSVPFRDMADDVRTRAIGRACRRVLYTRGLSGYRYRTLARFKDKFATRWESRMVAVGGGIFGVPLALIAITVAHRAPTSTNVDRELANVKKDRIPRRAKSCVADFGGRLALLRGGRSVTAHDRRRRWALSVALTALVSAVVASLLRVTLADWLLSEGSGQQIALFIATALSILLASAVCSAIGVRMSACWAGTLMVFVGAYLIPFVPTALNATVAPQVTVRPNPMGWASVAVAGFVVATAAAGLGVAVGAAVRQALGPVVIRTRASRRYAIGLAAVTVVAILGTLSSATLLSVGPVAMVYSYQASSVVSRGDVVNLAVDGRRALFYKPAVLRSHPNLALPVMYFLHGQPGSEADWLDQGAALPNILDQLIANNAIPPIVAVMPDGSTDHFAAGVWSNTAQGQTAETWIIDRLMPAIAHQVHALGTACTGIAGLSEGGFGAVDIALRHPHTFGVVAGYSGYFDADPGAFGPAVDANSPTILARQLASSDRMPIFLGAGTTDLYRAPTEAFASELADIGWTPTTLAIVPGGHSMGTWRPLIVDSLTWISHTWRTSMSQDGNATVCSPQF